MGGDLTVVSAAGKGSTFTVTLPLRVPADPQSDCEIRPATARV
jgi:signal transduction histidine kinase